MKALFCIALFGAIAFGQILAPTQGTVSPISPADGTILVGLRASAMGGAHIALAEDYTALWYNPARLSYIYRNELSGALTFESQKGSATASGTTTETSKSYVKLSQLGGVLAVPTTRGGLAFGAGYHRIATFNNYIQSFEPDGSERFEKSTGGMGTFAIGAGVQLSPILAAGATLDILGGGENYSYYHDNLSPLDTSLIRKIIFDDQHYDYSGVSGRFALAILPTNWLHTGLLIEFPRVIRTEASVTERTEFIYPSGTDTVHEESYDVEPYSVYLPFRFGGGLSLRFPYIVLTGDVRYCDYRQMEFTSPNWIKSENPKFENSYRDVLSYNLGAEVLIPHIAARLRGGFGHEPLHYIGYSVLKDRDFITAGAGVLLSKTLLMDVSAVFDSYENKDSDTNWTTRYSHATINFGLAYRF